MIDTSSFGHELRAGALRLAVRPDLGGCLAGLWHGTTPLMRSTEPAELNAARQSASFPLVPYSNRIGHHQFRWDNQDYRTAPNFPDSPHSLHGVAWMRPWSVAAANTTRLVLRYSHTPDEHWPFAFHIEQHITLAPDHLTLRFEFTNTDPASQPAGLGWHPYFPARPGSRIELGVSDRWERDATLLPTHTVPQPGIAGEVAQFDFDHCFEGWTGSARILDDDFELVLSSSLPYVVVFTPRDRGYFCIEPVSHVNNAIQLPDPLANGLRCLASGQTTSAWMKIETKPLR